MDDWTVFDMAIINRLERFTHLTQRSFGLDCFWFARLSVLLGTVLLILKPTDFYQVAILKISLPLALIAWLYHIQIVEKETKRCIEKGLTNPRKKDIFWRMFVCAWVLIHLCFYFSSFSEKWPSLIMFITNITIDFLLISIPYFESCDPLPPSKSRVRKLLEKGTASFRKIFTPTPAPQPTPAQILS